MANSRIEMAPKNKVLRRRTWVAEGANTRAIKFETIFR